jgi:hypothetical protein
MFRNIYVDHSVTLANSPLNIILHYISLTLSQLSRRRARQHALTSQQLCASKLFVIGCGNPIISGLLTVGIENIYIEK